MLKVHQFACLKDNYGFLAHDEKSGATATIDTPEAARILQEANRLGWRITHILNTHHHADHAGGNLEIKSATGALVIGPARERDKIPGLDIAIGEGDIVHLGESTARVLDVRGHTAGHIAYSFEKDGLAFVGDTLFAMGCGRLFEGTPQDMWGSLSKLMALPAETVLYCAHEYTAANARFALTVDSGNTALRARVQAVEAARAKGEATVPTRVDWELATNPFLRAGDAELARAVGLSGAAPVEVFAKTRRLKDEFRG
jgi:hydroxyacylglutathione hydrolase